MKTVTFQNQEWLWNDIDTKLCQVNDWIGDLDLALKYAKSFRGAIQAGGAMGVWPVELSKHFDKVWTYEPNLANYECLTENVKRHAQRTVVVANAGLGKEHGFCKTELPPGEVGNAGAFYTVEGTAEDVPQFVIDMIDYEMPIDFIQLDVEGREFEVLQGAARLVQRDKPVVMIEDKRLYHSKQIGHILGAAEKFLTNHFGYQVVERVHRDIILVHEENL